MELKRGSDVGQENEGRGLVGLGQGRGEGFENAKLGEERATVVHVDLVLAGPMEGFAGQNLEAFEVNAMAVIELDVSPGKIVADNANEFDGTEETGSHGGMAGGAAEEARVLAFGSFDGVEGGRADDEDRHG